MKGPAFFGAAAVVVALFACSSNNNGTSGFPFSGPSCPPSQQLDDCFSCYEQNCNGSCLTTACADLFSCLCACNPNDQACFQNCIPKGETQACTQCAEGINNSSCQQSCGSQCGGSSVGGGSGGSSGSGSGGIGGQACQTSNGACPITFCSTLANGTCGSAYYQVGNQIFPCASCSDTQLCLQEANDACMDAGPVADVSPLPDVSTDVVTVPDATPFDASGATCHAVACGTMGQSMQYCEFDNGDGGACTQAWYEVGTQVFACTDCSAAGCMAAEQAASMACP